MMSRPRSCLRVLLRSLASSSAPKPHSPPTDQLAKCRRVTHHEFIQDLSSKHHCALMNTCPTVLSDFSFASWCVNGSRSFHSGRYQNQGVGGLSSNVLEHKHDETLAKKDYKTISVELVGEGSVGLIMLDRSEALNALSQSLMNEVVDACKTLDGLDEVGAIVISGKGRAFAAGADIKEMKDKSFVDAHKSRIHSNWNSLSAIRKPLVAAVNGFALGGGCELALLCDILLAGERAVFGQPEITLGLIPAIGGTQRLIREVGKSRAMEMILTGKTFMNAEEAAQRGLVSRVVPGDNEVLVAEAVALAKTISKLSRPAVAMAKEAVNAAYEVGLREGIRLEHSMFCSAFALEDHNEGLDAFVEKRKPNFQHK